MILEQAAIIHGQKQIEVTQVRIHHYDRLGFGTVFCMGWVLDFEIL
jgi:hypothetical protein